MGTSFKENLSSIKFLQAENVQLLASNLGTTSYDVPDQYIRPDVEADVVQSDTFGLPVIDLAKLQDPRFSEAEIAKLSNACTEWGIFQLINHEVNENCLRECKADITAFFNSPLEQKKAVAIGSSGVEGYGQHFIVSSEQKLDWVDLLFITTQPVNDRNLQFWPTNPPTFSDTFNKYSIEMNKMASKLLEAMSKDLGIKSEVFHNFFKGQPQGMRMNYYPPCPQANKVMGLSAHTDGSGLTLLLNVNDVQGLQIRKDGKWLSVNTLPGAFVIFVGDVLEIASNGKYRSIEHRAVVNPTNERITIATFQSPNRQCTVGPLPEIVKGGKENYKSLPYKEFHKGYFVDKLRGSDYKESLKIK